MFLRVLQLIFSRYYIDKKLISVQLHFDEFNLICIDLESLDVKIDNEDKAILFYFFESKRDFH